jgi:hypothetical protein
MRSRHLGGLRGAVRDVRQAYREASADAPREHGGQPGQVQASAGRGVSSSAGRGVSSSAAIVGRADTVPEPAGRRDWLEDELPPGRPQGTDPDVVVDVPEVRVDEISLELDELNARVALDARVLDLLKLNVGVEAELRGVRLDIKGVKAQALLKARLDNVAAILDRVMSTVDANPQILERLTDSLGTTLEEVGSGAGHGVEEVGGARVTPSKRSAARRDGRSRRSAPGRARRSPRASKRLRPTSPGSTRIAAGAMSSARRRSPDRPRRLPIARDRRRHAAAEHVSTTPDALQGRPAAMRLQPATSTGEIRV